MTNLDYLVEKYEDKIIETACGIPVFEGEEADKRYIKYITEGINGIDMFGMKG
jgi:hypothetical protein